MSSKEAQNVSDPQQEAPAWEADLDEYPLREASEDPNWASRTVWIWTVFAVISLGLLVLITILGIFYD